MQTVEDFPEWNPEGYELGDNFSLRANADYVALCYYKDGQITCHAQCRRDDWNQETFKALANNLAGYLFDLEYPGEYIPLIKRKAEALYNGTELSEADKAMFARQAELDSFCRYVG